MDAARPFQRTQAVDVRSGPREAEQWDTGPLVGAAVFDSADKEWGFRGEMSTQSRTRRWEGKKRQPHPDNEFNQARRPDRIGGTEESENEQAVVATFLHRSQSAKRPAKGSDSAWFRAS